MDRHARFHLGLDEQGERCWRMKTAGEMRRCRQHKHALPRLVLAVPCQAGREVWRNGHHRRRWLLLAAQVRGDRRCFLTTLKRAPLVPPLVVRFS